MTEPWNVRDLPLRDLVRAIVDGSVFEEDAVIEIQRRIDHGREPGTEPA